MSSSDKSTLLRTFNIHFFELLDDLIRILPENVEILTARKTFGTIKQANPTAIIKVWYAQIYIPYSDTIDAGDLSFFYDKNYISDVGHLPSADKIMSVIDSIRDPIRNMSDVNKEHTKKYLQNLSKLSTFWSKL